MFCGETEQAQTFISETNFVKLQFQVDNYTEQTYWAFDSKAHLPVTVYQRYGQHPELYPNRRGIATPGTYCERAFVDCRLQTCYVQSPAFPGVTPRGLHCRYRLNTTLPHIKLYLENEEFNVDGQRCENIMTCPMRPISSGAEHCPHDFIRIYDGRDERAPLVGVFCGMGRFPFSIIGTGNSLLVEFVTSPAGPLLHSGFHFNVGSWPGRNQTAASRLKGPCSWLLTQAALRHAGIQEGVFLSVVHWYPPHTTCTYHIQGSPGHVVRLSFPSFRINRIESPMEPWDGDCGESLTLYDASWPDDTRIIRTFCDTFSRPQEKIDFVSSSESMFVRFESKTGSYSGSSLYYWAQYDFFNNSLSGDRVPGTACDELIPSWRASRGTLRSPTNTLVYRGVGPGGVASVAASGDAVRCTYRFVTDSRLYARVEVSVHRIKFREAGSYSPLVNSCWDGRGDRLLLWEPPPAQASAVLSGQAREIPPANRSLGGLCMHQSLEAGNIQLVSRGPVLLLQMSLPWPGAERYFRQEAPLFEARYRFVHGPLCGPAALAASADGQLVFPHLEALAVAPPPRAIDCRWELNVHWKKDLYLHFEKLTFTTHSCSEARLQILLEDIPGAEPWFSSCGDGGEQRKLPILQTDQLEGPVTVTLTASSPNAVAFNLRWTELQRGSASLGRLQAAGVSAAESPPDLRSNNDDCAFVCPGTGGMCIPAKLVCNGVLNCPPPVPGVVDAVVETATSDEDPAHCAPVRVDGYPRWTLYAGAASAAVLALAALALLCKACCCCGKQRGIEVPY
ncbi:hypothetical protein ONE63_002057 [Megalurothrips usitatus]|uniref:CUB domain-containing protein n=1 Tax=Megalurothrips usitatus TaxID=439358 RepID=A0AAV7XAB1_9NEOP|nr:hypothetical protein ONE63_002057 [Megalurothrips usitatus]